jgi:hypothetical protein
MFNFLKKCTQGVCKIPEPLSIRERALKIFSKIEGLDDIKEMMLRAIESSDSLSQTISYTLSLLFSIYTIIIYLPIYYGDVYS